MRFYRIEITNSDNTPFATYTSGAAGAVDLGALQVEFDIPVSTLAQPIGAASIKVWGVSLTVIGQATDFVGKSIKVYGGFVPGLPLATEAYNAGQQGLLLQGLILQAYGNWIGTQQWVEFVVGGNAVTALNQTLNLTQTTWAKGTPLALAVANTLTKAVPTFAPPVINISPNLVLQQDEPSFHNNLVSYAQYLYDTSRSIIQSPAYTGVQLAIFGNKFVVSDNTLPATVDAISFDDLIGQPTWIGPGLVQVMTMMRADIQVMDYVTLPTTQVTIAPSNQYIAPTSRSSFQGKYFVQRARHLGNFRDPNALSWITAFDLASANPVLN